jgi:ADP-heptose:LPS heptosyltransferase
MNKPVAHIATRLLFFWNKLQHRPTVFDFTSVRTILCAETSRMGDVVSCIPFLNSLHRNNPDASITVAVDARYIDIVRCVSCVSTVIGLDDTASIGGLAKARRQLKGIQSEMSISVSPSYRNALLTLGTTSKFKIGYFESKTPTTPFLHRSSISSIGFKSQSLQSYYLENIEERALKIAKALGIDIEPSQLRLKIPDRFVDEADVVIRRFGFGQGDFVILHPFSAWFYRNWNFDNYVSLAERLGNSGIKTIIIGNTEDREVLPSKFADHDSSIRLLVGSPLSTIIGLMSKAALFVGNDSGPLHLATAVGIPCIGLFGPSSPALTAPQSDRNIYFYEKVECSPCDQTKCIRPDNPCVNLISSDRVVETALRFLNQTTRVER